MALSPTGFVLGIRRVSSLLPHEQTIPSNVQRLADEITRDRVQKDPIVIDAKSSTVLDGMHRLAAFKQLGLGQAVVCAVDYQSDFVQLKRWARVYSHLGATSPQELLSALGPFRRVTSAEAFSALDNGEAGLAVLNRDTAYVPDGPARLEAAIDLVNRADDFVVTMKWERRFIPEDEIDSSLQGVNNIVVLLRRLGKEEIVKAATTANLFPCKSSMHLIDPRPVGVNFPIDELDGATSQTLEAKLKGKRERLLPANSIYGDRRYKERLLVLS